MHRLSKVSLLTITETMPTEQSAALRAGSFLTFHVTLSCAMSPGGQLTMATLMLVIPCPEPSFGMKYFSSSNKTDASSLCSRELGSS